MRILLIGQCTLHWGRMEHGNIGNYYIIEPFVRALHDTFPGAEIATTFQMTEEFCERERVTVLPMELYYAWRDDELERAEAELAKARSFPHLGPTPFINEVLKSDLVIDFSGDIWGDNADFLGKDRFMVGLCKDRVAQLLGKPTVMIAGSPGPFHPGKNLEFAQQVFRGFHAVSNREPISAELLAEEGFETAHVRNLACPAFLFEPASGPAVDRVFREEVLQGNEGPVVGFVVCGWNFTEGPFDKWPRPDEDYTEFAEAVEAIEAHTGARMCLMSHSNGFHVPPAPFELIHGRDYPIIKQLQSVLEKRGRAKRVFALDGIYDPWTTKALIGRFDMLVSGRVHAAVAGLSQNVPTVVIDYGHEPKAHKLRGFARVASVEEYVADPARAGDIAAKAARCWDHRATLRVRLQSHISGVKALALENFSLLKEAVQAKAVS